MNWMTEAKYGIFMHYQYRILLNYSIKTDPILPELPHMTDKEWNRFANGSDVEGFIDQMTEAKIGWVLFCIDDHFFAWLCAPNKTFSEYTGYAPGEKCSHRDLILKVTDALNTGLIKDFVMKQMINIRNGVKSYGIFYACCYAYSGAILQYSIQ